MARTASSAPIRRSNSPARCRERPGRLSHREHPATRLALTLMFLAITGQCLPQPQAEYLAVPFARRAQEHLPVVWEQLRQQGWVE